MNLIQSQFNESAKGEAGNYVEVIAARPACLKMIIATGSYHGSIISAEVRAVPIL